MILRTLIAALFVATPLLAVTPLPPYNQWPACETGNCGDTNNCYSYRSFRYSEALQTKDGDGKSPRTTATPTSPYGICSGYYGWCKLPPQLGAITPVIIPGDGTSGPKVQLIVPYDFPNNYCQVYDDGPPCRASVWPPKQTLFSPVTRLAIYNEGGDLMFFAPAVFEKGVWMPTLNLGCGTTATFIVEATNGGDFVPGCTTTPTVRQTVTVTSPSAAGGFCNPDRRCTDPSCAAGGGGGANPPRGGGKPIHFGSGDVSVNIPLFTIAQSPLSLSMALAYHSSRPMFPNIQLPEPLGSGWTHTFNDVLLAVDAQATLLYRVDGLGFETLYQRAGPTQWTPRVPGELIGRETVSLAGGEYRITKLDGTVTAFSSATGRWLSTTDRWGNAITGTYNGANLASVTDSVGRVVTLGYSGTQLTSVALPTGETWRFSGAPLSAIFDPMHTGGTAWRTISYSPDSLGVPRLLHEMSDESGAVLEGHEYDALERGRASYAESGRDRMTVTYGALGPNTARVVTSIDNGQTQTSDFTFVYQRGRYLPTTINGSCASCGGAEAESQSFTWDAYNHIASATDGNGHVTRFTYDASGNLVTRTEASGTAKERTLRLAYEHPTWLDFVTKIIEPSATNAGAQKVTAFSWNATETVLTRSESGFIGAAAATFVTSFTYDARHRLLAADGRRTDVADVTSFAYYSDNDAEVRRRGRRRQSTDPVGLAVQYDDYDIYGTPRLVTDPNGVTRRVTTDARGRTTQSILDAIPGDPNENSAYTSAMTFDGRDRLLHTTRPRGNGNVYEYEDGTNRLLATIRVDASGNQMERHLTTPNLAGGAVREEDQRCASPSPHCGSWITKRFERFTYDAHNRLKETLHAEPAGAKIVYAYDRDGLIASMQDENHTAPNIRYTYDALDRLVSVAQTLTGAPGGVAVTRYDYDVHDNLASFVDANGNVTRYVYDDFGRLTRQESPVNGVTTYAYDADGNLTSSTDARGAITTHAYDAGGRPLTSTSVLGATTETVTNAWDDATPGNYGKGRLASMTDPSGSTSYAYERRGMARLEAKTILGDSYITRYEYDANRNRRAIVYPSGRRAEYTFDFADRPLSLNGTLNGTTHTYVSNAGYLPFGPESSRAYGGSLTWNAEYDASYRLESFDVRNGAAKLAEFHYAYDAAGNVATIADALDPRYSRSFGYDDLHRLTRASTGAALWGDATYTYDPIGNRLAHALGTRVSTYTYRTFAGAVTSQLQAVSESGRNRAVDYDAAGNEQLVGSASFSYSPRNLLAQGDGVRYIYDANGVRVAQVGVSVGPLITTQPLSQPVCPGGSATLVVTASGANGYQWQSSSDGASWQDVASATSRTLTVTPASTTHYRVIASNAAATTTSDVATITPTALAVEPASGMYYGDVTQDGVVNASDVTTLRAVLAGLQPLAVPQTVADLDGDGAVDAVDLSLLGGFAGGSVSCLPRFTALQQSMASSALVPSPQQAAPNPTQYFFYSPEKHLLAQTGIRSAGGAPAISNEYLWFNGAPVSEERIAPDELRFTFTDHLGTPFLQTSASGVTVWRAEYDPFGTIFTMRTGTAADQRLRFPGQELDDQSPERAYNIFRWYRPAWGRYTQVDPLGLNTEDSTYAYANDNPLLNTDPLGLYSVEGFSYHKGVRINRAMKRVYDFLRTNPCCTGYLGNPALLAMIEHPDLVIRYDPNLKYCGQANPIWFFTPEIVIGPKAFDQKKCKCLAGTLIHEISHLQGTTDLDNDILGGTNSAYALEKRCKAEGLCPPGR